MEEGRQEEQEEQERIEKTRKWRREKNAKKNNKMYKGIRKMLICIIENKRMMGKSAKKDEKKKWD